MKTILQAERHLVYNRYLFYRIITVTTALIETFFQEFHYKQKHVYKN